MGQRRNSIVIKPLIMSLVFILAFVGVLFGIQFVTKTGFFRIPGEVIYDESLTEAERQLVQEIFTDEVALDADVLISARTDFAKPEPAANEILLAIEVPVADFYETRTDVSEYAEGEYQYIPLSELDFKNKLLTMGRTYYLDDFTGGAKFRTLKFESEKFDEEILPLIVNVASAQQFAENEVLKFAQTGVTALSRRMNGKLYDVGSAEYFSEKIANYLNKFDLTHTSNESSFSEYAHTGNICSDDRFIETLRAIGLDIVELTGNHNQDCGDADAARTIDIYNENGIRIVGGGKTVDDAAIPLVLNEKNNHITMLAYNQSTGGVTYDNTPGANQYHEEDAVRNITEAKNRGDFVIVDVQYYECSTYASEIEDNTCDFANSSPGDQVGFFRHLINLGADIVVGTSAHQPQTFELYRDGAIYYGLGNLFFDQSWWPGTTRSLVLEHYFYHDKLIQTRIVPTIYDGDYQVEIMSDPAWFIKRLVDASSRGN